MGITKYILGLFFLGALCVLCVNNSSAAESHVVFVTGDDEYASELSMPMIARILEERHGMKTTVLYATNEKGEHDHTAHSIPGTETLATADAAVFFMRWRELPQAQLDDVIRYAESGKPMLGLRTTSHAVKYPGPPNDRWNDGLARQYFGQKWISHYGHHNSTLAHVVPTAQSDPILRGVAPEFWLHSWLYVMNHGDDKLPADCRVLLEGDAIKGDQPGGEKFGNREPMAWTRELPVERGRESFATGDIQLESDQASRKRLPTPLSPNHKQRIFYTSLGHPRDFTYESPRRLLVNAIYWALGRESDIPAGGADVAIVGEYNPPDPK